jgi:D-amino-acid oxidase
MGARALASDDKLCPVRGQHLVITNPGISQFTEVDTGASPNLIAIYAHEEHLLLGGTAEPGRWDREPSPQTAAAILARCAALELRLRAAEVIGHRVALRPMRNEVRLEEQTGTGRARLIHNYGHGGAGVSLAWGCANEVATLIDAPA